MKRMTKSRSEQAQRAVRAVALAIAAPMLVFSGMAVGSEAVPRTYVLDFLAASGEVVDINEAGQVIGERNIDEGCDPFCIIVPSEAGVWDERGFTALPMKPAWSWVDLEGISGDGWIVGTAYMSDDIRGVMWKPSGPGYDIVEIPGLPGTDFTAATGIDDSHRVIGSSYSLSPPAYKGFVWSEAAGIVDLTDLGFPGDTPLSISPAGTVAFVTGWYELDVPGLVHLLTDPPPEYQAPGGLKVAINDAGDQARYIAHVNSNSNSHAFRYTNSGEWQYLGFFSPANPSNEIGGITSNMDITATLSKFGWVAEGPNFEGEPLADRLSSAYGDANGYKAGPLSDNGQMAAVLNIGKAPRVVRLVPGERCLANCLQLEIVSFRSEFVDDPNNPGSCVGTAHTSSMAKLKITAETGMAVGGVAITGRFLTEYRHDGLVRGTSNDRGIVTLTYQSAPCTGAMTFLATDAVKPGWTFDRTVGTLQQWLIPQ